MSQKSPSPPEMLCFALYSAAHAMQAAYKPLLDPMGLTYPQYLALASLWAKDAQTVGQISATLHLDSNTITPLLKRLEQAGYLIRSRDPSDERQVRLTLTEKGHALREQAISVPQCFLDQSGLGSVAAAALRNELSALRDRMRPR